PPPREEPVARRERGAGRPTKRDLRRLRKLRGQG
ncbi:MAG: RNA-binding S4 domain-containing protein, partial [Deltaproteobacteria bacterium]|nr:RNA-binding S4 domain-containing protein [Deltaproteobacteria bacterium]